MITTTRLKPLRRPRTSSPPSLPWDGSDSKSPATPSMAARLMVITSAEGRNLGFDTPGFVNGNFDCVIRLNTSITYPPSPINGSNYGLQSVANHEIDEALGIGGAGSTHRPDGLHGRRRRLGPLPLFRAGRPQLFDPSDDESLFLLLHRWGQDGPVVLQSNRRGRLRRLAQQSHPRGIFAAGAGRVRAARYESGLGGE